MDPFILAPWRDAALIWLVLLTIIMALIPLVALYFIVKGVRAVKRRVHMPMLQAQVWALRIQHGTVKATDSVAAVPIKLYSAGTRASVTARGIWGYLLGR